MRLVDDQSVVCPQLRVAVQLRQQNAVGHQLYERPIANMVGEADFVADGASELRTELFGGQRLAMLLAAIRRGWV